MKLPTKTIQIIVAAAVAAGVVAVGLNLTASEGLQTVPGEAVGPDAQEPTAPEPTAPAQEPTAPAPPTAPVMTDEDGELDLDSLGAALADGGTGVEPLPFELPDTVRLLAPVEGEVGSGETMWVHTLEDGADPAAVCVEVVRAVLDAGYTAVLAADCSAGRVMAMYEDGTRRISLVLDPTGLEFDGRTSALLTVGVART